MKILCILIGLALAFMGGWFCAIDATNTFLKTEVPLALPDYEPAQYLRYGGGVAFEHQMKMLEYEGKKKLVAAWDKFQVNLWPWDAVKKWRGNDARTKHGGTDGEGTKRTD